MTYSLYFIMFAMVQLLFSAKYCQKTIH